MKPKHMIRNHPSKSFFGVVVSHKMMHWASFLVMGTLSALLGVCELSPHKRQVRAELRCFLHKDELLKKQLLVVWDVLMHMKRRLNITMCHSKKLLTCNYHKIRNCIPPFYALISMTFFPKGRINCNPAFVKIMACRRPGGKPLSDPMVVGLLAHIYVTR